MTLPKQHKIKDQHIQSMKIAVEEYDIRAIHPDRMEEYAAYLVEKMKNDKPTAWRTGGPLEEQSHGCLTSTLFYVNIDV